jgi:hypothetical protein
MSATPIVAAKWSLPVTTHATVAVMNVATARQLKAFAIVRLCVSIVSSTPVHYSDRIARLIVKKN